MQVIRVGTRGSLLALVQAQVFVDLYLAHYPETDVQVVPVRTSGDRIRDRPLHDLGGKKLFIKELEEALRRQEIDVAIHSLKDVEWESVSDLMMGCYIKREDPRDVLITRKSTGLYDLPKGATIGTVSCRRAAQVLRMRSDLNIVPIRGNVDTRLAKLDAHAVDALILAYVALKRLKLEERVTQVFSVEEMVPAPGQGVLAVQCRARDTDIVKRLAVLNHHETEQTALAERAFVERLGAHCQSPIGGYAWYEKDKLMMRGFWEEKSIVHTGQISVRIHDPVTAGLNLAEQFLLEQTPLARVSRG